MDVHSALAAALQKIDIQTGLGISADEAADIIVNPAADQLFSDNVDEFIQDRVAALEMYAQRQGHRQTIRTPHILDAIEPVIRASSFAQRKRR